MVFNSSFHHILGRGGIGHEALLKRRKEMQENFLQQAAKRRRTLEDQLRGDFKIRMKGKFMDKQVSSDVWKAQKACEQLDNAKVKGQCFSSLFDLYL